MKPGHFLVMPLLAVCITASGWGVKGHQTIALVAEKYLTKNTRSCLDEYLGGRAINKIASYPDEYRRDTAWFRDLGVEITNPQMLWPGIKVPDLAVRELEAAGFKGTTRHEPWCHSMTVMADGFVPLHYNLKDSIYIRNCVYELEGIAKELKARHKEMDEFTRMKYIALVTHLVGDMHCPMHCLYDPVAPTGGTNKIFFADVEINLHSFWDTGIFKFVNKGWSSAEFADLVDDANKKKREEIVAGTVYDWAHESAKNCWPCQFYEGHLMDKHQKVSDDYPLEMSTVLYQQLRDAGYRLAVLLNWIFEPDDVGVMEALYFPKSKVQAADVPALMKSKHVEYFSISTVNWPKYSYCPDTKVAIAACKDAILLHYVVNEESVRASCQNDTEAVFEDSCVEFFCSFSGEDNYYNFEFNCIGTALVGVGPGRYDRTMATKEVFASIDRWASLGKKVFPLKEVPTHWELALVIPYTAFFRSDISSLEGKCFRSNFFKCGNKLPTKHYVSLFPICSETVNFHSPKSFGEIKIVGK